MYRLSKRTIGNGFLTLIWIICAFIDIHHGENYGGIIYKFFASAVFLVVTIHNLLIDFGKVKPIEKKKEKWHALITIVVIIVATVIILGNYDVETYKYNIKSEKIPESFDGFRIAQVSDLHNAEFDKYNSTVLQPIFLSRPNIIVITGDMIDSRNTDVDVALSFAQKAVNIAPVYYINGNHESRVPEEYEELKKGLTEAGVTVLENESVDITIGEETISLIGINDPTFRMKLVDDTMEQNIGHQLMDIIPDNDNYKVLLAHRPEYFDVYAGKRWLYGNSALYYYGVENVLITIKGWTMPLEKALEEGRITLNGIIAKCNQDIAGGIIDELVYKDGGSQVYKYPDYTIVKYHTLDGNDDMYIGTPDIDIHVKDK